MSELKQRYCPNCGAAVGDGVKYCPECGKALAGNDNPEKISGADGAAQPVKGYVKYKDKLKKHCIIQAISGALTLVAFIMLMFIPAFGINLLEADIPSKTTLPKLENAGLTLYINFSFFDEIIALFSSFSEMPPQQITTVMFQVIALVYILFAIGMCIFMTIKNVISVFSPENYAITEYDKIKKPAQKRIRIYSPMQFFISGLLMEVLAIIFSKVFSGLSNSESVVTSYFAIMNTVDGSIAVIIIFALAAIAVGGFGIWYRRKIKLEILQDEYVA